MIVDNNKSHTMVSKINFLNNLKHFYNQIHQTKRFIKNFTKVIPQYDEAYITDPNNISKIEKNIQMRKGIGNIYSVHEIVNKLKDKNLTNTEKQQLQESLQLELRKIPNKTHPEVERYENGPKVLQTYNEDRTKYSFKPLDFSEISKKLNIIRTEHLGNFSGYKSYFLMNDLADLEQALIQYTMDLLKEKNFELVTVPDILPEGVIESCGMSTTGERTQVYRLVPSNLCLSGTSEMALAGLFSDKIIDANKLPIKLTAVSRCFRAETSSLHEEKGIYRAHQFTKVEMFSVCSPEQSSSILEEFKSIEIELYSRLGLHFKLLDMPPEELGAPAYRKYDIEAWLPGRQMWGEISSCSNCSDYQSRRLGVKINHSNNSVEFPHTVNGTACAIPRMLIAILETYQNEDLSVSIPEVLRKYISNSKISKRKVLPELKLIKNIASDI